MREKAKIYRTTFLHNKLKIKNPDIQDPVDIRCLLKEWNLLGPVWSVADPDPDGSGPFSRIRIRSNFADPVPDPDPTIKIKKSYNKK